MTLWVRAFKPMKWIMCFSCVSGLALAYDGDFDEKPWVEQQAQLPPFPKSENLLRIPMDTMGSFEVAIDITSIDIGKDDVIRYIFTAKSGRGSENVSFEGIRCETRERKLYAIGRSDKTWGQVRNASWATYGSNPRSYHYELAKEYFCPDQKRVMNVSDALENLKGGGVRTAESRAIVSE